MFPCMIALICGCFFLFECVGGWLGVEAGFFLWGWGVGGGEGEEGGVGYLVTRVDSGQGAGLSWCMGDGK